MPLPEDPPVEEDVYDEVPAEVPEPVYDQIPAEFTGYDPQAQPSQFGTPPKQEVKDKPPAGQGYGEERQPTEFDPKWKDEFLGLLYVGAMTSTFSYLGHKFVIRTLTQDELLEVALAIKEYMDTDAGVKAHMMAIVAACVVSVDGQALPHPITLEIGDSLFQNHWRYVRANWYPPVIDAVFTQYARLEWKVREVIDALGEASG